MISSLVFLSYSSINSFLKFAFSALFASLAYLILGPQDSIEILQYVFLQSCIIAFLSSSGVFRGLSFSEDSNQKLANLISNYFTFLVLSSILTLAGLLFFDADLHVVFLVFGGFSVSALNFLTGVLVRQGSTKSAYRPQIEITLVALLGFYFYATSSHFEATLKTFISALLAYQISSFLYFILKNSRLLKTVCKLDTYLFSFHKTSEFALMGFSCSVGLLVFYFIRNDWAKTVGQQIANDGLFYLRVSDLILQFVTLLVAFNFRKIQIYLLDKKIIVGYCIVILTTIFLSVSIISVEKPELFSSSDYSLLFYQLFIDVFRYSSIVFFIWTVSVSVWAATVLSVLFPAFIVLTHYFLYGANSTFDLYFYYAFSAISQILLVSLYVYFNFKRATFNV